MKRALTLLLTLLLCLGLALPVLADAIYEPEDGFYQKHRDECYYENRVYIASGEAGFAAVHKDPKTAKTKEELPNGAEVYVSFVWDSDGGWGLLDGRGWVPMSELTVKYDSISFAEEHGSEFRYLDEWEFIDLTGCEGLRLWEYPGDAEPFYRMSWSGEDAWFTEPPEDLSFNTIYEDPEGRRWGYIHYFYGFRDCWVCLTDPDAAFADSPEPRPTEEPAPTDTPPAPVEATPAPKPGEATPKPGETTPPAPTEMPPIVDPEPPAPFPWLPALLSLGALVVAGGLLALFRRKK